MEADDIDRALEAYATDAAADTLITTCETRMQTFFEGEPINIRLDEPLTPSQQDKPVHPCNLAVTIWDARVFKDRYRKLGYAYTGDRRILFPISPLKSIKVSNEDDFVTAEALLLARRTMARGKQLRTTS